MSSPNPACPIHLDCACTRMAVGVERALAEKLALVTEIIGAPDAVVASPRSLGYRARVDLKVGSAGELGYHQPRSHRLMPITCCPVARDEINAVLAALPPMPPGLARVELRTDGHRVVLSGWTDGRPASGLREALAAVDAPGLSGVALSGIALSGIALNGIALNGGAIRGETRLRIRAGGVEHEVGPDSFYQVNLEINVLLVDAVREAALAVSPAGVLDLYAGIGNLGLPLAAAGVPVTLWESSASACADARRTAKRLGLKAEIINEDAARFKPGRAFYDVLVLDPPRAGSGGALAAALVTRPSRVIYVSCEPRSLARDLRVARAAAYKPVQITLFDMFPQTGHIELLVVLDRERRS